MAEPIVEIAAPDLGRHRRGNTAIPGVTCFESGRSKRMRSGLGTPCTTSTFSVTPTSVTSPRSLCSTFQGT